MFLPRSMTLLAVVLALAACPRSVPPPAPSSDPATKEAADMKDTTPPQGAQGKRAAGQENEPVLAFRGFGNEPFWSARVDGDTLVFSTPENQEGTTLHGRRMPSLTGMVFAGKDGDRDFNLTLTPGDCNDGMSDNRYEYKATFILGDATYKGCGEAAK